MPVSDAPATGPSEGARSEADEERDGEPRIREVSASAPELTRSDERVLAYLADAGTDYPAFVASNTGLYADHVESRLDALEAVGFVERATGETVYRITDAGRAALRDDRAVWSD
jgi:DNA-binding MarR family transcriptional regulator